MKNFFAPILIFALIFALIFCFSACGFSDKTDEPSNSKNEQKTIEQASKNYKAPQIIGKIADKAVTESSGIVASRRDPNVFWTHNDSGDDAFIYAFDRTGKKLGVWKIDGAKNLDWEDIAAYKDESGECFLFLGDIGNNNQTKSEQTIYRIAEPKISASDADSTKKKPISIKSFDAIKTKFPDRQFDSESLAIQPISGDLYILTKNMLGASSVYKLSAPFDVHKTNTLEKIAEIEVPAIPSGFLTGADISPDGKRVIICDYFAAYELTLPDKAKNFDEIWKAKPDKIDLGERKQGEAICYRLNGKAILATSEKAPSPIIEVERK